MALSAGPLLGLLLAAGRGTRFDASGASNKLLAQIDGEPIALRSARKLRSVVDAMVIVVRPGADALVDVLRPVDAMITVCENAAMGMGHSLAHGVAVAQQHFAPRAILVALADMPFVDEKTLQLLAGMANPPAAGIIAAPRYQGRRGHPVLFDRSHFESLQLCSGDSGASALMRTAALTLADVSDSGVLRDVDQPDDLPTIQPPSQENN